MRINNELVYVNREVTHMFIEGQLIQLSNGKNLTEERKNEILSINFRDLPFQQAIVSDFNKSDQGSVREIAVFEDPNCGYCRKFRRSLSKIENLRVYTFLYPILGDSSVTISKNVWCSANPSQTWDELMLNDVEPSDIDAISCKFNLESFLAVGKNLGIQATPTIFLSSGERLRGAVSEERLREARSYFGRKIINVPRNFVDPAFLPASIPVPKNRSPLLGPLIALPVSWAIIK
ncbi:MAG: hypothetical protein CM15mP58_12250 [Burkholderiaceae bacterium]|nr:MAG: hypothetical protein CM15mP58_12250 [Burkholderiaceae bacterium]